MRITPEHIGYTVYQQIYLAVLWMEHACGQTDFTLMFYALHEDRHVQQSAIWV